MRCVKLIRCEPALVQFALFSRRHLASLLGVSVAASILVGALAVGDCVRGSLVDIALARIGRATFAFAFRDRFFRSALAEDLPPAAAILQLPGTASTPDDSARANHVQILGVNSPFWALAMSPVPILTNKGLVYVDLRDGEHAKQNFDRALAMDRNNYRAWIGLGVLAVRSGDVEPGDPGFQRSTTTKATEMGYTLLAKALDQAGRTSEAQAARDRAKLLSNRKQGAQAPPRRCARVLATLNFRALTLPFRRNRVELAGECAPWKPSSGKAFCTTPSSEARRWRNGCGV